MGSVWSTEHGETPRRSRRCNRKYLFFNMATVHTGRQKNKFNAESQKTSQTFLVS